MALTPLDRLTWSENQATVWRRLSGRSLRYLNLEPRVSPALCQRLVAGRNSGIMEFL